MKHYPERGGGYDKPFNIRKVQGKSEVIELGGKPRDMVWYTQRGPAPAIHPKYGPEFAAMDREFSYGMGHQLQIIDKVEVDEEAGELVIYWHNLIHKYFVWESEFWDGTLEHR